MDVAVIILTLNEEIHIARCIENAKLVSNEIYVIDSFSEDNTKEIAEDLGAKVYQNKWPGTQGIQFNWALDNLPIKSRWILKIDADEYLVPDLVSEINEKINLLPDDVSAVEFKLRLYFLGKWIKRGAYPNSFLRMFRFGKGRSDARVMDEHIVISDGKTIKFNHDFVDHNLKSFSWWLKKHINYAQREAVEMLRIEFLKPNIETGSNRKKYKYIRSPIFIRAILYFIFRYIIKGGIIEGKSSFVWNFFQGLWYRLLVDTNIWLIKKHYNDDEIKTMLLSNSINDWQNIINVEVNGSPISKKTKK